MPLILGKAGSRSHFTTKRVRSKKGTEVFTDNPALPPVTESSFAPTCFRHTSSSNFFVVPRSPSAVHDREPVCLETSPIAGPFGRFNATSGGYLLTPRRLIALFLKSFFEPCLFPSESRPSKFISPDVDSCSGGVPLVKWYMARFGETFAGRAARRCHGVPNHLHPQARRHFSSDHLYCVAGWLAFSQRHLPSRRIGPPRPVVIPTSPKKHDQTAVLEGPPKASTPHSPSLASGSGRHLLPFFGFRGEPSQPLKVFVRSPKSSGKNRRPRFARGHGKLALPPRKVRDCNSASDLIAWFARRSIALSSP